MHGRIAGAVGALTALLAAAVAFPQPPEAATVALAPDVRYQTIRGWSATPWYPNISPWLRDQLLDAAVNDLGLTRIRWGPPSGNRSTERDWEWENDDGDPTHLRWEAFNTAAADQAVRTWVLPFKRRVEANGDPFEIWVSPSFFNRGSTGAVPAWLLHSPGEYAEYATSFLLHLKGKHGLEADYYVILNEAGNHNPFSPRVVARMIRTLGPRLRRLGLRTKIQFPDCINADTSWRYIQAVKDDPEVWKYVGALSYHLYGNNSDRVRIRDFARARGLPTGQTEYMGLTIDHLYDDLTLGGVSYWSIYGLAGVHPGAHNFRLNPANTAFRRGRTYWDLRQVMHYVRPGAVRIGATSDNPLLRVLAFLRGDRMTVILINKRLPRRRGQKVRPPQPPPYRVALQGLRAGRYGLCECVAGRPYRERGVQSVGGDGRLSVHVPADAVVTLYPYPGVNQPPTVTDWRARPDYLTRPASRTTLSAAATDPENDPLAYAWSVKKQPPGARVVLASPRRAETRASGLDRAGEYLFAVAVSDPTHTVMREVLLRVFAENQPPLLSDVHNRIPVRITLPRTGTTLCGWALDLERDPLTFRWSVLTQPKGAHVLLETPDKPRTKVSGLTVAGEYVFRFEVRDPKHSVHADLRVPVYPVNHPPRVRAGARPALVTRRTGATRLTAETADPDGDVVTHWWSADRWPGGAPPKIERPGAPNTRVTGLSRAGEYVFTLTAVDRTEAVRTRVIVTVR